MPRVAFLLLVTLIMAALFVMTGPLHMATVPAGGWLLRARRSGTRLFGPGAYWLNRWRDNVVTLDQSSWTATVSIRFPGTSAWFRGADRRPIRVDLGLPIVHRPIGAAEAGDLCAALLRRCADALRPAIEGQSSSANLLAHDRLLVLVRSALADVPDVAATEEIRLEISGQHSEKWGRVPIKYWG